MWKKSGREAGPGRRIKKGSTWKNNSSFILPALRAAPALLTHLAFIGETYPYREINSRWRSSHEARSRVIPTCALCSPDGRRKSVASEKLFYIFTRLSTNTEPYNDHKKGMLNKKWYCKSFSWSKLVQKYQKEHNANEAACNSPWGRERIGQMFFIWKWVVNMMPFLFHLRFFGRDRCLRIIDSGRGIWRCRGWWC